MTKQRGLKHAIDPDIADAKRALEEAGLTHEQLLHMAAQDWIRNIRLKNLLDEAEARRLDDRAQWLSSEPQWLLSKLEKLVHEIGPTLIDRGQYLQRCKTASAGGKARRKGQAQAKEAIRAEWGAWQAGDSQYHSQGIFASKMCEKYHSIESSQTIENWCRKWKKELAEKSLLA